MTASPTITTNLPFGLFSSATLSGPLPKPEELSALFNIDDAGPATPIEELDLDEENEKPFWED